MHPDFNDEENEKCIQQVKIHLKQSNSFDEKEKMLEDLKHYNTLKTTALFGVEFNDDATITDIRVIEEVVATFKAMHYFHSIENFDNCLILQDRIKEFEHKIEKYWQKRTTKEGISN